MLLLLAAADRAVCLLNVNLILARWCEGEGEWPCARTRRQPRRVGGRCWPKAWCLRRRAVLASP
jgi:hypothetical protein